MSTQETTTARPNTVRILVIGVLVIASFFGAYKFAQALTQPQAAQTASTVPGAVPAANGADPAQDPSAEGGAACACCGTGEPLSADGVSGETVAATAAEENGVQTIAVDLSTGIYNPNVITLKAGVPAEITFGQGSGCTAQVMSKDLNFFEDLTAGTKTVKVAALQPGEYSFSCGMEMVFGKIVVE